MLFVCREFEKYLSALLFITGTSEITETIKIFLYITIKKIGINVQNIEELDAGTNCYSILGLCGQEKLCVSDPISTMTLAVMVCPNQAL